MVHATCELPLSLLLAINAPTHPTASAAEDELLLAAAAPSDDMAEVVVATTTRWASPSRPTRATNKLRVMRRRWLQYTTRHLSGTNPITCGKP